MGIALLDIQYIVKYKEKRHILLIKTRKGLKYASNTQLMTNADKIKEFCCLFSVLLLF